MKPDTLAAVLVRHGLLDSAAVHDPEGYDNGATLSRVKAAAAELAAQPSPRAESADKQARTLPSCDACRHWLADGGACSRRYTTGWCSFYARRTDALVECDNFKAKEA